MTTSNAEAESPETAPEIEGAAPGVTLSPAARRALEEAAARRREAQAAQEKELGGPSGLEPTRYGDWERKGRAVDF
ncbi:MAG: DUF1674 domain-containing protein [Parvularculaceae bacterium]|nr:DUF1674 domain-containing protein [Parvularculaceae bacterium]